MGSDTAIGMRVAVRNGTSTRMLEVDDKTDHALFWALRGGGNGNFGVVTAIQFAVHRVPSWSRPSTSIAPGVQSATAPDGPAPVVGPMQRAKEGVENLVCVYSASWSGQAASLQSLRAWQLFAPHARTLACFLFFCSENDAATGTS